MKIELCHPDRLPFDALTFLSEAIRRTPSNDTNLQEILRNARDGEGQIYILSNEKIVGATYIEFYPQIMNIVLLGGEDIHSWKDQFYDFCIALIREKEINHICVVGRAGWGNIFKQLKPLGMLYLLEDRGG